MEQITTLIQAYLSDLSSSDITAVCAVVVAVAALMTSIWQGYVVRKHNILSVIPNISVNCYKEVKKPFSVEIESNGLGPAVFGEMSIICNGRLVSIDSAEKFVAALSDYGAGDLGRWYSVRFIHRNTPLLSGTVTEVLGIEDNNIPSAALEKIESAFEHCGMVITYRSMYGDAHWTLRNINRHSLLLAKIGNVTHAVRETVKRSKALLRSS